MGVHRSKARRFVAFAGLSALLASASVAVSTTPSGAVLGGPYTHVFVETDAGTFLESSSVTPVNPLDSTSASFNISSGSPLIAINFGASGGLQVGDFVIGTTGGMFISDGASCTMPTAGHFTVDDIAYDGSFNVLKFSARFHVDCGINGSVEGAISYNSTADYRARILSPAGASFGSHFTGTTSSGQTIALTNHGPSDLHVGSVTLGGPDVAAFDLSGDTCSGATLAVADSCSALVTFAPALGRTYHATLTIVDDIATDGRVVPLSGTGVVPTRTLVVSATAINFGQQRVGTYNYAHVITVRNDGNSPLRLTRLLSYNYFDFEGATNCPRTLAPGASCIFDMYFVPTRLGARSGQLVIESNATNTGTRHIPFLGYGTLGYFIARASGRVSAFGDGANHGNAPRLFTPIAAMATTPNGEGYWLAGREGTVYSAGNAGSHGSLLGVALAWPIVGMVATPSGKGYWMVASDGGAFAFGDARFHGSTGGIHLNKPIMGMASTVSGKGYWLVASDGGIFAFGDARFYGSTGAMRLNKPIVGMAPTPSGRGYWLVASDGGVFSFGDAHFYGSTGALALTSPIVGMQPAPDGRGYWFVARDGGLFSFGPGVTYYGSLGGTGIDNVVAMAGTAPPL
ncbi:MAG: Esterase, partial [Actinomycetia bacterium]|nr:Esterase [Actinomycetes bacterium]